MIITGSTLHVGQVPHDPSSDMVDGPPAQHRK
jgi:hypothetical protein